MKLLQQVKQTIIQAKKNHLIRLYLRLLPTLIGLSVISTFLLTQPKLAQTLTDQFLSKLQLKPILTTTPNLDLLTPLNELRQKNQLKSLESNSKLDQVARLATLSLADDLKNENSINLKQLAAVANYPYSTIAYLAAINPLPLVRPPTDLWINDPPKELLDPDFTQIGTHQFRTTIENQDQLITIVILATPAISSPTQTYTSPKTLNYYTGVELWTEIQKYRVEHGVPQFRQDNTLCTIASIRVNQLLELGKLDNHDGFTPLVKRFREEGKLTHTNIAENILSGYPTAKEAVSAWDSSLGHQALMRDGSYVFACAAANQGFAVLIAAF